MSIHQIRLYDLFRKELHLPDAKAAAFVVALDDTIASENDRNSLPMVSEINKLDIKIDKLDIKIDNLYTNVHSIELKVEQSKTDIYKAMFWTGIVQLISILGGTLAIVKFMK
jgi:hypothetical protein